MRQRSGWDQGRPQDGSPPPVEIEKLRRDWDDLAHLDPFWAVLTEQDRRFRRWNARAFFATGEREIEALMKICRALGYPQARERALDFGCGVGRLTRPLGRHFAECCGIDISPKMIELAEWLNPSLGNCRFVTNANDDLRVVPASYFDLIYTINVLQHMSTRAQIESYLAEFVRTLKAGGLLVAQLPAGVPLWHRIRLTLSSAAYASLRKLGVNERFVYETLRLSPIRMNSIREGEVVAYLESLGASVLRVEKRTEIGLPQSRAYFVTK